MKLTAKVDEVKRVSGRGLVFCANTTGGGFLHDVSNVDGFAVDDELVVLVLTKEQAWVFYHWIKGLRGVDVNVMAEGIADQLHPDPPVPFLVDSTADTQEFVRP